MQMRLVVTLRAPRKPHILVRMKKEAVKRWLFPQLSHSLRRWTMCHWEVVPPSAELFSTPCYKPLLSSSSFNARKLLLLVRRFVI
jgi:hypothetical protein